MSTFYTDNLDELYQHFPNVKDLLAFVESHSGKNRWWFSECYADPNHEIFTFVFRSYNTPEYRSFELVVIASQDSGHWAFTISREDTTKA